MSDTQYVSEDERWEYLVTSMILGDQFIHEFIIMMSKHADESILFRLIRALRIR